MNINVRPRGEPRKTADGKSADVRKDLKVIAWAAADGGGGAGRGG
ncbi:MAG TPA: hypothetical protein VNX25_03670 [Verrucomicrobiae bacterium]|nr:hypothetical protein [Verrucomicrobiae bacterium]